jgi:catechol 2,3-dioxygenase-like lactoylglutathione lyase family enzyme
MTMIHALDHIVLAARDPDAAAAAYENLLGRRCDERRSDGASFHLFNLSLVITTPTGTGGDGLAAIAFAVTDLDKALSLVARRGLPSAAPDGSGTASLSTAATHGVLVRLVECPASAEPRPGAAHSAMSGLDHVVIRSPNPDRAVALYAGRLGLDLRLDRSNPDWGSRLLFFRCGDLVVEIVHDLKAGVTNEPDELWGLSWRVPDLDAAHVRLASAGIDISEVRTGRRPGTRVFTIRDKAARVPTLVIGA